jgi:hypothetical protein
LIKRAINVTDDRNAKDDVNRAKNPTLGGIFHDWRGPLLQLRVCKYNPETRNLFVRFSKLNSATELIQRLPAVTGYIKLWGL